MDEAIQDPDGETKDKYVLYQLDEARRYSLALGVGAELGRIGGCNNCLDAATGASGFYPRVSVDVARNNLFGLAHSLSLRTQVSTIQQRALLNYTLPHFTDNDKVSLSFTGLLDNSKDIRTYNYTRLEGAVQLSQRLTKATTLLYRLAYRRVSVSDLKVTPFLISQLSQPDKVGIASINLVQDRRDDPMDPHHGVYNTVDFGVAEHILGSARDFTRMLIRNSSYYPIGKKYVLARSTQIGYISAFHYSVDPADAIPLPERYFGGGDSFRALSLLSGRAARHSHRLPTRRQCLGVQSDGVPFPADRRQHRRGSVSRHGKYLFELRSFFFSRESEKLGGLQLYGARRWPRYSI